MEKDPIKRFRTVFRRAQVSGIELPEAAALATVSDDAQPSVRMVLLKHADDKGFVFYTNLDSQKGRELKRNPRASLCFWWPALQEQVRIEGSVELVSTSEADDYFATRDRNSQLGAWASQQSSELPSLDELRHAFDEAAKQYEKQLVPRPPHWSGYRLRPDRIEFWLGKPYRLHERYLYSREGDGWMMTMLYP
ncbi:MAG: pyridoxamine 5'-phosphate oxidase [Candidatus Krumholzibacteria bacterium]|nr:pyridoxamine 5'-phosphate oxidase [Candidatus Krumholzibacteria bacterium]